MFILLLVFGQKLRVNSEKVRNGMMKSERENAIIQMLMVLDKRVKKCKIVKHRNLRGGYRYYDGSAMY